MSTSEKICNDVTITKSSSDDGICEVIGKLQNLSTSHKGRMNVSVCENCGKEGSDNMNTCNKCKMVKYCNATCKKKHRSKHKKACDRRVAELQDEKLFKQPPPEEDCPICFLRLPTLGSGRRYQSCCGKVICSGCICAPIYDDRGNKVSNKKCPFCRTPTPTKEEMFNRIKKRVEAYDANAMYNTGNFYRDGRNGFPEDMDKAIELYHQAAKLGYTGAYNNIGFAYLSGRGVEVNETKARHYYELAAIGGSVGARHNLGIWEENTGNYDRALKHHMIAIRAGEADSLKEVKELYKKGHATKEDYTKALQLYQSYLQEIKSPQRDKAAADREDHRYY